MRSNNGHFHAMVRLAPAFNSFVDMTASFSPDGARRTIRSPPADTTLPDYVSAIGPPIRLAPLACVIANILPITYPFLLHNLLRLYLCFDCLSPSHFHPKICTIQIQSTQFIVLRDSYIFISTLNARQVIHQRY